MIYVKQNPMELHELYPSPDFVTIVKEDEMGCLWRKHGRFKKCAQKFGQKTAREETTWENQK
jgi:hypothetical protein